MIAQDYIRFAAGRPFVQGLPDDQQRAVDEVFEVWSQKLARNALRQRYYDSKNSLKDLGISIPPPLAQNSEFTSVIGWAQKAVTALAVRSRFDGFVGEGADKVNEIFEHNGFRRAYKMGVISELVHSCAFVTTTQGVDGKPRISFYSALNAAAVWDFDKRRIKTGMTVLDVDRKNVPTGYVVFTDDLIMTFRRDEKYNWSVKLENNPMGRPLMEPFCYRQTLDRPFGSSRITRAVMSITDEAVRECVRESIGSEFNVAPQRWIMGADAELFKDVPQWQAYIGSFLAISRDENGDSPTVGQFAQGSMEPHISYMRSLAARFAGETSIPVSSLGIISDNPSSAEAIYAAKEDLVIEAEGLNEGNSESLRNVARMAVAIANGQSFDEVAAEDLAVTPKFMNPARPSVVSQADAMVKLVSIFPWLSESPVALEEVGFNEAQIERMMSDKRKKEAADAIKSLNAATDNRFASGSGFGDTRNFYRIASVVKDYKAGRQSRGQALRMLNMLGISDQEANDLLELDSRDLEEAAEQAAGAI